MRPHNGGLFSLTSSSSWREEDKDVSIQSKEKSEPKSASNLRHLRDEGTYKNRGIHLRGYILIQYQTH